MWPRFDVADGLVKLRQSLLSHVCAMHMHAQLAIVVVWPRGPDRQFLHTPSRDPYVTIEYSKGKN